MVRIGVFESHDSQKCRGSKNKVKIDKQIDGFLLNFFGMTYEICPHNGIYSFDTFQRQVFKRWYNSVYEISSKLSSSLTTPYILANVGIVLLYQKKCIWRHTMFRCKSPNASLNDFFDRFLFGDITVFEVLYSLIVLEIFLCPMTSQLHYLLSQFI